MVILADLIGTVFVSRLSNCPLLSTVFCGSANFAGIPSEVPSSDKMLVERVADEGILVICSFIFCSAISRLAEFRDELLRAGVVSLCNKNTTNISIDLVERCIEMNMCGKCG